MQEPVLVLFAVVTGSGACEPKRVRMDLGISKLPAWSMFTTHWRRASLTSRSSGSGYAATIPRLLGHRRRP